VAAAATIQVHRFMLNFFQGVIRKTIVGSCNLLSASQCDRNKHIPIFNLPIKNYENFVSVSSPDTVIALKLVLGMSIINLFRFNKTAVQEFQTPHTRGHTCFK
jgi:hypothetical protein